LDRLCGPLCDAVTDSTGSATILEELERANWFVVPLDSKRQWYCYQRVRSQAPLCLARAAIAVFLGEPEAGRWLTAAEDAAAGPGGHGATSAAVATLRAIRLLLDGHLSEAVDEARRAMKLEADASP
jgi:ATP/maltotriose-dependent transcriptional regulator MalT